MTDYGHDPQFGVFITPAGADAESVLALATLADRAQLDLVTFQDHPYQARFLETCTLLSFVAARTSRVRVSPNVLNLPLRNPAVVARAVASLDILSGGRAELGIGAGAFWDGIEAMGGPRRTPKEAVDALEEAIPILRDFWSAKGAVTHEGEHYRVKGLHPGPPPAHPIGIWLGAYGPRMLRITGRTADGWLPSLGPRYRPEEDVPRRQAAVDEAARAAGRDPGDVERAVNVMGLEGDPSSWADELTRIAGLGFSTLFVSVPGDDPAGFVRRLGEDVAPLVRERAG
jgi:alkanesulfonate monooxygenase SsuD/methylene tetrahydromethanopterin reductase-like flavin-dependent oxidoreductase (luciferase family)